MSATGKKYKRADLDNVEVFMSLVDALADEDFRERFRAGEDVAGTEIDDDKLRELIAFMRTVPADQLAFLASLKAREDGPLTRAELFDEYNPRLYYL